MTSVLQYRDPTAYRSHDPMSTANFVPPHMASLKPSPPYEGHSSGSESKKGQTPGAKRRPSRAGTRSVTTLTAAQLERKRANDREAQRAIRQRTKDHIESLERQIKELTAQQDGNSSSRVIDLLRRNEELEQENAALRARLSHTMAALGVPDQNAGNVVPGAENTGFPIISATGGAPSPSDRIQMLSQPRRSSTSTARSVHSVPEIATPVSQPSHWQQHHQYPHHVSSPHVEGNPSLGEVQAPQETVRWSPHPHPHTQHHPVSMPVQDSSLHAMESSSISYPAPYGMDQNSRAMSYPLENPQLVTSQPMQMTGYGTPTSNPSPHPSDYQRHLSLPINVHQPAPHSSHPPPQQGPPPPPPPPSYTSFPQAAPQGYVPQSSHPGEMQQMIASHPQHQMVNEQGHIMYHHMPSNMKVEH